MASLPEDASDDLKEFQLRLGELAADMEAMLSALSPSAPAPIPPLRRAEALLALAHAVHALDMLHVRTMGKDPTQMPAIHKEQARLDAYKKKVAKAVAADELSRARKTVELDVGAANRFISAAIPELTDAQRAALRAGNAAGRKRNAAEEAAAAAAVGTSGAAGQTQARATRQRTAAAAAPAPASGTWPSAPAGGRGGKGKGKGGKAAGGSAKDHAVQFLDHLMQQDLSQQVGTLEHMQGHTEEGSTQ